MMHIIEFTYNRILYHRVYQSLHITEFFLSLVGVQNIDLVQKVPIGTLQNITDFLCFLLILYSDSYHSYDRVFISPVGVQNKDLVQKVPIGTIQNRTELITHAFFWFIIQISYHINVCPYRSQNRAEYF